MRRVRLDRAYAIPIGSWAASAARAAILSPRSVPNSRLFPRGSDPNYGASQVSELASRPDAEITVGPQHADVVGADNRAIQIAIDALAPRGGGTVRLLPGRYVLDDAVRPCSNLTLAGDREKTVLTRAPKVWSQIAVDADIGEKVIVPTDVSGFRPGMGVCLRDDAKPTAMSNAPLTVVRVDDGKLYLGEYIEHDWNAEHGGLVVNYFPLIYGRGVENVVIDGVTVDQRLDDRSGIELLRSSGVYFERCTDVVVRNVTAQNVEGDGICCATCTRVTIEDCETAHNIEYGVHLGSHSPHCKVLRCDIHHNGADGLYLCWGVRHALVADNTIHHNGYVKTRNGISIGHKDTDNLLTGNRIFENICHGVSFRRKTEPNGAHRNTFRENVIENNGAPGVRGCGIHVNGVTRDLLLERNAIREMRFGEERYQRHALRLEVDVSGVRMVDNQIEGHPDAAIVDRSGSPDNELQTV